MKFFYFLAFFTTFLIPNTTKAQYITNGNASAIDCHCYQLTDSLTFQRGSVWNANKIDLSVPFDFTFDINFGCLDNNGADGIAFILQPISTSVGGTGSGLGFQGIVPSLGVLMDTYLNSTEGDPTFDHISINKNGDVIHGSSNNLAGPIQIANGNDNVEDCNWHLIRVVWNPVTNNLSTYFDGNLRLQTTVDMINSIFGGNPQVYWGFSGATGGLVNRQKFCTRLSGQISSNISNNDTCIGAPVNFSAIIDAFIPIASYYWNFGDGATSILQNPPPHIYSAPGQYIVKFVIKAIDGCDSDTAYQTVTIGALPTSVFTVNDTCQGAPVNLVSNASIGGGNTIAQYLWIVDGITLANAPSITSSSFSVGVHNVKHLTTSNLGCNSDTTFKSFTVFPKPVTGFTVNDTCESKPTTLTSSASGPNLFYGWIVDGVTLANAPSITNIYTVGVHNVKHFVTSSNGCTSDTSFGSFTVFTKPVANFTVNDTCAGLPVNFQSLTNGANLTYQWYVDGNLVSTAANFSSTSLSPGIHSIIFTVTNNGNCSDTKTGSFTVLNKPILNGMATNACFGQNNVFTATVANPPFNNLTYQWFFNDGTIQNGSVVNKTFISAGSGIARLYAQAANACNSDTVLVNYNVVQAFVNAGNDTLVVENQPFHLNGQANGNILSYNWQPASYFTNNTISNPTAVLTNDQLFTLSIVTVEGCTATDDILVKVFKGSNIYVPNGFTPNGDNKNDILKPLYIGIRSLSYFRIFNRWGKMVFNTASLNDGWNALLNGKAQPAGTYVFQLKATDYFGKEFIKKGTILIIR